MHVKIEKKYKSKAAIAYRNELEKLVEAEAAKRGDGTGVSISAGLGTDLLANLELADNTGQDQEARAKLAAARAAASQQAIPQAKLASTMPGASKLVVTPPSSGNAPKLVLRKPAGSTSSGINMLKKKPNAGGSKLRVNKLAVKPAESLAISACGADNDFDSFETLKPPATLETEAPPPATAPPEPAKPSPVAQQPSQSAQTTEDDTKAFAMKDGIEKMKAMNSDFFSNF